MAWKEIAKEQYPCPCGKATYTVLREKDEWSRVRVTYYIDCLRCARPEPGYEIYPYEYQRNGLWYTGFCWGRTEQLQAAKRLRLLADDCFHRARAISEKRYLKQWLAFFEGRNKRAIWDVLTENGGYHFALPTFYKHTQETSVENYLTAFFRIDAQNALEILAVCDDEITALYKKAELLDAEAENLIFRSRDSERAPLYQLKFKEQRLPPV